MAGAVAARGSMREGAEAESACENEIVRGKKLTMALFVTKVSSVWGLCVRAHLWLECARALCARVDTLA